MFMYGMDGEARGEDQDFPGLPAPLFSEQGLSLNLQLINLRPGQLVNDCSDLLVTAPAPIPGVAGWQHYTQLFIWKIGIPTQVLMLGWKVLCQLSHLPSQFCKI